MADVPEGKPLSEQRSSDRIEPWQAGLATTGDHDAAIDRLRQERDFMTAVLDTAGALVVVLDRQGRLVHISRHCEAVSGYTCEQVRGQPFWDKFIAQEEREQVRSEFERLQGGHFPSHNEHDLLTSEGSRRHIAWSNTALTDTAGAVEYVIATGIDVTEQREAAEALGESQQKLQVLFDLLPIGISILDEERHVVQDNAALRRILGLSREDLQKGTYTRRTYIRSDGTPLPSQELPTIRALTEQEPAGAQVGVVTESGKVTWTDVSAAPVPFSDWKVVAATTDITELKQAEKALRQANEELEQRVAERTLKLAESNLLLEQEIRERRKIEEELRRSEEVLEQRVEDRIRELAIMLEISNAVALSMELKPLVHQVLDLLASVVAHDGATVYRLEEDVLHAMLHRGPVPQEEVRNLQLPVERSSLAHELLSTQEPIAIPDIQADTPPARALRQVSGERLDSLFGYLRSWLGLPLVVKGQVVGLLTLQRSEPLAFDEHETRLAQAFAGQLAVALENARFQQQSQKLAAMEERQHLARELHDAVSQTLFSASLAAEVLPRLWEKDPEMGQQCLAEVRQLTRGALAEMRTLLLELRPAALLQTELPALLQQLAEAASSRARISVTVDAEPHCPLPAPVHLALYRIVQEALNNIAKHAEASQASIELHCATPAPSADESHPMAAVKLSVADDGCGFDLTLLETGAQGMGLNIIRERAKAVGADLRISSATGLGTQIAVTWPASGR